ncbi:MAG: argininosuccinate lyase [Candidatus Margulisiibacteriota bacterium]|jgi:argininosuccinate lyase
MAKLWGGRFSADTNKLVSEFTASHQIDSRLYQEDILLNLAYSRALLSAGILKQDEFAKIEKGLQEVKKDIEAGEVSYSDDMEDVHTHIEHWLTLKIGEPAKKIHTGKSRNDQVVTDLRMYLLKVLPETVTLLAEINQIIIKNLCQTDIVLPGYTHLQKAQPVTLALHYGAYVQMFQRDIARLKDALKRIDVMSLGAGALAGNPFLNEQIRQKLAKELGFSAVAENSMDAVSDRDFVVETLAALSLIMVHLSRMGEELVLWSSEEFGYVQIGDAFTTGSSIMPQKKNPDVAELIRGKAGRVFGALQAVLVTMKGLPLSYNRDMQEDKEMLFLGLDTVLGSLQVLKQMLPEIKFNYEKMRNSTGGFIMATRLAEYLVKKGVAFREAHVIVGKIVAYCLEQGKRDLKELSVSEYQKFSAEFKDDVLSVVNI